MPNPAIKDENLNTARQRRGASGAYEAWTVVNLRKRAKEFGLTGYSSLNKEALIDRLRSH